MEHAHFAADISLYLTVLPEGRLLEVGVGTGRIMAELLKAGRDVWGVDPSCAMLSRAIDRVGAGHAERLIQTSIQDLDLDQGFDGALLPLNTLWHLTRMEDQRRALEAVRRHLEPGSVVCVDLSNPWAMADRGAAGEVRVRFTGEAAGRRVVALSAAWDDEEEQILRLELMYDVTSADGVLRRDYASLRLRYLYRRELELLLGQSGFRVRSVFGSYELDAYSVSSPNLIVVAAAV